MHFSSLSIYLVLSSHRLIHLIRFLLLRLRLLLLYSVVVRLISFIFPHINISAYHLQTRRPNRVEILEGNAHFSHFESIKEDPVQVYDNRKICFEFLVGFHSNHISDTERNAFLFHIHYHFEMDGLGWARPNQIYILVLQLQMI